MEMIMLFYDKPEWEVMEKEIKQIALQFHNTYEELAPKYGYETRKDTRELDFNSQNGQLMYATIKKVVKPILNRLEELEREVEAKEKQIFIVKTTHGQECGHLIQELHAVKKDNENLKLLFKIQTKSGLEELLETVKKLMEGK